MEEKIKAFEDRKGYIANLVQLRHMHDTVPSNIDLRGQEMDRRSRLKGTLRRFVKASRPDFEKRDNAHLLFMARSLWIDVQAWKASRSSISKV